MDLFAIKELLLITPLILLALTVHEVAHGWVAEKFGDNTARIMGRITLNPIAHLDPMGTLLMFLAHFGWAKPVPVDPRRLNDPKKDMVWISLAGPGSNIILAALFGIGLRLSVRPAVEAGVLHGGSFLGLLIALMILGMEINLGLGLFNLIPIHPLDGSKIVQGLLPLNQAYEYQKMERYGTMIIFTIFLFEMMTHVPILSFILRWPMGILAQAFSGMHYSSLMRMLGVLLL